MPFCSIKRNLDLIGTEYGNIGDISILLNVRVSTGVVVKVAAFCIEFYTKKGTVSSCRGLGDIWLAIQL